MDLVFPSRVDTWLAAVMIGGTLMCALLALPAARKGLVSLAALAIATVGMAVGSWMVLDCDYRFEGDTLIADLGPFSDPLFAPSAVTGAEPSRDRRGAPASSLDRLAIHTPGGVVLVSPDDRVGFLDALAARSGLVREGERLVHP